MENESIPDDIRDTNLQESGNGLAFVILDAHYSDILGNYLKETANIDQIQISSTPKLLEASHGHKCILDYVWENIKKSQLCRSEAYLITDANKYKYFERWAISSDFPAGNIINNGSTLGENSLCSLENLNLLVNMKQLKNKSLMLIQTTDSLIHRPTFDDILNFFYQTNDGNIITCYSPEDPSNTGLTINQSTHRIMSISLHEDTPIYPIFCCFRADIWPLVRIFHQEYSSTSIGPFVSWLINKKKIPFYALEACLIKKRVYARVGLMGNPSDGFNGRTISLSIKNFWTDVTIRESVTLRLLPHELNDGSEFSNLKDLHFISTKQGYLGGLKLLQATCKIFYQYCSSNGIPLGQRNFTLSYETNIPRQVGLAGSSAIITGVLKCLMSFYGLDDYDIAKEVQPSLILSVERDELHINAGLQDRVVQIYQGLVYMDFNEEHFSTFGYGIYKYLKKPLPKMYLVYENNPTDSGKIHSEVTALFSKGDKVVVNGMTQLAELADQAVTAINKRNWPSLRDLVNKNFELRRQMYGEDCLGKSNMKMIEIGKKHGAAVKFSGSGGSILVIPGADTNMEILADDYLDSGFTFIGIVPLIGL